jgi:hypothetical protein
MVSKKFLVKLNHKEKADETNETRNFKKENGELKICN